MILRPRPGAPQRHEPAAGQRRRQGARRRAARTRRSPSSRSPCCSSARGRRRTCRACLRSGSRPAITRATTLPPRGERRLRMVLRPGAPERAPRRRADDPVRGQAAAALEALHGSLGRRPEYPHRRRCRARGCSRTTAECLLPPRPDDRRAPAAALARARWRGRRSRRGTSPRRRWKRITARLVGRAEDAVRGEPEPALDLGHTSAVRAALERLARGCLRAGREHERHRHRPCGDRCPAPCLRHDPPSPYAYVPRSPTR